uniref:Uncharacterized protein n=1 Tax=Opuntia streptacantha TaxID=393608 RepID=A0A7C9CVL4_OPUST
MKVAARPTGSTPTMLSLLLPVPSVGLELLGMQLRERGSLLLSSLKPPMRPLGDGRVHQMARMLGDTASIENRGIHQHIVILLIGLALLVKHTMAADLSN